MKKLVLIAAVIGLVIGAAAVPRAGSAEPASQLAVGRSADFGSIPLYFVANHGQAAAGVLYEARASRYRLAVTAQGLAMTAGRGTAVRMVFEGARPDVRVAAADPAACRVNYFFGSGPDEWKTDIPTARAVSYEGLYPGVDLKVYGVERQVEYDWVVRAGADPAAIAVRFEGADEAVLDGDGNLVLRSAAGELVHRAPVAFQDIEGRRAAVDASFEARLDGSFGFRVGRYDRLRDLVIDPYILGYSTFVGTGFKEMASAIGVDATGAVYIAGMNYEFIELTTPPPDAYDRSDNFVTKIAPDGQSLVYTSYFPVGQVNRDWVWPDLAVDAAGNAYLGGLTNSNKFPVKNAYQATYQGGRNDGYLVKLAPTGKRLLFSTYLGGKGHDAVTGVAVDAAGAVYLTGETDSPNFPLANPIQKKLGGARRLDAFVTKLAPTGKSLVYSTYLGGSDFDRGVGIAVDEAGGAYVTGLTESLNFPLVQPLQAKNRGNNDFYVSKVAPDGRSLSYSTFLGSATFDLPKDIAVGKDGCAVVVGYSGGSFPVKNAFQSVRKGSRDAVVAKLSATGKALVFSSFLGGVESDIARGVAVRDDGVIAVVGDTESAGFPRKGAVQTARKGFRDGFVALIPAAGKSLLFSTYLGGKYEDFAMAAAFDAQGRTLVAGYTMGPDFPVQDAAQAVFNGGKWDSFVTRFEVK